MKSSRKSHLPVQHPKRRRAIRADEAPCRKDYTEKMNPPKLFCFPTTTPYPATNTWL